MAKIRQGKGAKSDHFYFFCPGCGCTHSFRTGPGKPRWSWNNDFNRPTVRPSINYTVVKCHFYVEDGMIRYLDDCRHELANQTVEMEDIDEMYGE